MFFYRKSHKVFINNSNQKSYKKVSTILFGAYLQMSYATFVLIKKVNLIL